MALTWNLTQLAADVRNLAAMQSTVQISDTVLFDRINDFLVNHFPLEVSLPDLRDDYWQQTAPTDDGDYALDSDILALRGPFQVNGVQVQFWQDRDGFFHLYPKISDDVTCALTDPALVAGVSDTAKVKYSAFAYRISGYSYTAAAGEAALSGSAVPANKYGAWRLEIAADGTLSCVAATLNATGYATPTLALLGLPLRSSSQASMGFVTARNTAGVFTPGTTSVSAATVTATFTDGDFARRSRPLDVLVADRYVHLRPQPDDIYLLGATKILKGTALGASDVLPDAAWGPMVSYGAAILLLNLNGHFDRANTLAGPYEYLKNNLSVPFALQATHRPACVRRF